MLHLHFGPSPLALGLLLPASLETGFDVAVIARAGDINPKTFGRGGSAPGSRLTYHRVKWFEGPTEYAELPENLRGAIESETPMLITASLRKQIADRVDFAEAVLRVRPPGAETIVLACENDPHSAYEEIRKVAEETGATMLKTVVNRMCVALPRDDRRRRMVSAHPLGEWLIERPVEPSALLDELAAAKEVEIVDDIDARENRKLWMVNGAHQALALMARAGGHRTLRGAARSPAVLARLAHIHSAMNEALRRAHPELSDNLDYGVEHVVAYCEHKDGIDRVLAAYRRADLSTFLENLDVRLAAPARWCARDGISVEPLLHVVETLERLVKNVDGFSDAKQLRRRRIEISSERDERAVAAYQRMLAGWLPEDDVARRSQNLRKVLDEQAKAYSPTA